ncbi:MAG: Flp pilus assembly complex ATPase component TadA [Candidatus Freyarchaeota archaeon]|nr:Flp pilus assembly complex ATPase component TadA [Candidatus Jordarchaeia archaeon]MBS7269264.1 Flp pilus assembly complex ATPase component TadA [Candidatus Jordarchaeia archaeon]MBS7280132.1 Flp pilus assembly complex ATPase component TadA [Candidatus Jordarchaeia archaeon]
MKYVVDTSILLGSTLSKEIEEGSLKEQKDIEIIIPQTVLAEIEHQANSSKTSGMVGLEELRKIRRLHNQGRIVLTITGERPSLQEIAQANSGALDELVRKEARKSGATLMTSDYVQAVISEAEGIDVMFVQREQREPELRIQDFFAPDSLSVHLKDGVPPQTKRGKPGNWRLENISDEPMTLQQLQKLASSIIESAEVDKDCFIEIDEEGATVVQLHEYRIAITTPPLSDRMEITAVRPLLSVSLDDYHLSEKLKERLKEKAEGILVAGRPGAGKSTFAGALAEFYQKQNKIVKTLEKPRDLQVGPEITQYTALRGDMEKTADILLLVRPDYVIYDELRKTKDFQIFSDLRFAGVGLVGVVHASRAIDAIERFIGRVELGLISRVIDTVIFIEDGEVDQVLSLRLIVKVPSGMTESDLARPVIEVLDFETGQLQYEIYTYGEQTVVIQIGDETRRTHRKKQKRRENFEPKSTAVIPVEAELNRKHVVLTVPPEYAKTYLQFYVDDEPLFTSKTSRDGQIRIRKSTLYGKKLTEHIKNRRSIYAKE